MHHFIADQLNDLAVRGKLLSVLVQESAYLVTFSLADRGITFRQLSPYDVSRSLRGDPDALAIIRAELADLGAPARAPSRSSMGTPNRPPPHQRRCDGSPGPPRK